MSSELHKEVEELKALILAQKEAKTNDVEKAMDTSGKYVRWIQGIVGLLILLVGLGVNWGITKTKIEVMENNIANVESVLNDRISKAEGDIHELQLKQAGNDQILKNIQSSIEEMKADVKTLLQNGGQ